MKCAWAFALSVSALFAQDIVPVPNATIMLLSPDKTTLYVGAVGQLTAIDVASRQIVGTAPLNVQNILTVPYAMCLDPKFGLVVPLSLSPNVLPPCPPGQSSCPGYTGSIPAEQPVIDPSNFSVSYFDPPGGACGVDANGLLYFGGGIGGGGQLGLTPIPKVEVLDPADMQVTSLMPAINAVAYIGTGDGVNMLVVFNNGSGEAAIGFVRNGVASNVMLLPISVYPWYQPPIFSPDGKTAYLWGTCFTCGSNHPLGTVSVDMVNQQVGTANTLAFTGKMAFSGSDPSFVYALGPSGVSAMGFSGRLSSLGWNNWKDPNGMNDNQQLIVIRHEYTDTLIVLEANQVLFWDVPRTPIIAAVVDGATFSSAALAPNSWFTVFGSSLSSQTAVGGYPIPRQLDTARVMLQYNGKTFYTPLYYASPDQLNALIPADATPGTTMVVTPQTQQADGSWTSALWYTYAGISGNFNLPTGAQVTIGAYNPGIFVPTPASMPPGASLTLWCNGLGPVTEAYPFNETTLIRCASLPRMTGCEASAKSAGSWKGTRRAG